MEEERDNNFDDDRTLESVSRFERMLKKKSKLYFDVEEFEDIIDYYIEQDKYASALEATDIAYNQHPTSISIQIKKAQILTDRGKVFEALKIIDKIEKIETSSFEICFLRGSIFLQQKNFSKAINQFNIALSYVYENKDEYLVDIARTLDRFNFSEAASKYLLEAYKENPSDQNIIFELAFLYEKMDKNESSIEFYNKFLDIDPFAENAWFNLGYCYNRMEKYDKAVEAYDYAIAIDNTFSSAIFNKANCLANDNKYEESITAYEDYLEVEENYPQAYFYIAECYVKLQKIELALLYYNKTIELDPKFADAYFGKAMISFQENDFSTSMEHVNIALSFDENNPEYHFLVGKIALKKGDLNQTIDSFNKVTDLDKFDSEAWYTLAYAHVLSDHHLKAIDILTQAIKDNSDDPDLYFHLGGILIISGQEDEGLSWFRKGMVIFNMPDDVFEFYPEIEKNEGIKKILDEFRILDEDSN